MNEIQIFNNAEFGEIRTVTIEGESYFVGKDVTDILKYQNGSRDINRHTDEEDRCKIMIFDGRQDKETIIINESGLYSLILGSKMPNAKKFKRWVTSEVLPSIRKTGIYTKPMSFTQLLELELKAIKEVEGRAEAINDDLQTFKRDIPLFNAHYTEITKLKNKIVVGLLGGKKSNAYRDSSVRGKVYSDLSHQLKREFNVTTYQAIKEKDFEKALEIVENYKLPLRLQEEVQIINTEVQIINTEVYNDESNNIKEVTV